MLDAHVRFELERLTGAGLEESVRDEVDAVFGWLRTVRLADLAPAHELAAAAGQLAAEAVVSEELIDLASDLVAGGHRVLVEEEGSVEDLLSRDDYDALVAVLTGMEDARSEILELLTTSNAYAKLVSHVLYNGVKRYVLTENLLARKIPGASALVRLGQRGLTSAAPKLEANVDRQLLAFVQANVADTLRESQRYLDEMLDGPMLTATAEEIWDAQAGRSMASIATLADSEQVAEVVRLLANMWEQLRLTGVLAQVVQSAVAMVLERHHDRLVGDLLAELSVTQEAVAAHLLAVVAPGVELARADGYLESRIRNRLEAFYASYKPAGTPNRAPRAR